MFIHTGVSALLALAISAQPTAAERHGSSQHPSEQVVSGVEHAAAADLLAGMAGTGAAGQRLAGKLSGRGAYRYMMVRRNSTSQIQAHDAWDEIIVVKEGTAAMLYGGLSGGRDAGPGEPGGGPGEKRGGQISSGTMQTLAAGDFLMIPAGVAHQVHVEPGQSVVYLTIRIARAAQPSS